ncbi:amino acid adenylation domain-containing protein [Streptomyces sp. RTd22]|uniref:amino acid adenylation domain-containing protein n=1 Tax=Streptomyces sp. RTd22 TaxID=1841249 RepID=UPI0007C473B8|nr:amino acid adenylation domain-containing protein [Streptomyces sp. RTd22]
MASIDLPARTGGLHDLVTARARSAPEAVAVTLGPASVGYGDLLDRAERLARRLCEAGVRPGDFVGVAVDRSLDAVTGLLGVLLSGAAYVPIAAELPGERIRAIADDANIGVVTGSGARVAEAIPARWIPADGTGPGDGELPGSAPDRPAYAIFTSGSTGRPKGVVVPHRAVVASTLTRFGVYPYDDVTYLMLAPLSIDAAVAGLFFTLAAGGRVVIPTAEEVLDPLLLAELVRDHAVSHLDGLPSQYAALLRFHPELLTGLRCVITGGESLHHAVVHEHMTALPDTLLFNEYGPTESTVWATVHRCTEADAGPLVPIGPPISGVRATVRAADLSLAEPGDLGEIYLGGAGLAWSYLGRPALTAERFVADPDPRFPGERMYRTGDLGHMTPDGELVFQGRTDNLVKVRGFRVELGELEAHLLQHPDLLDAAVVPHTTATGLRLVAVVEFAPGRSAGGRALSAFLADRLPAYMLPTRWRQVPELPRTGNGKVDRRLLRESATTVGAELPA